MASSGIAIWVQLLEVPGISAHVLESEFCSPPHQVSCLGGIAIVGGDISSSSRHVLRWYLQSRHVAHCVQEFQHRVAPSQTEIESLGTLFCPFLKTACSSDEKLVSFLYARRRTIPCRKKCTYYRRAVMCPCATSTTCM